MNIEYYVFSFYVFILICVIILLCGFLFSKFKKKKQLFDEKEAKLLKLYQTVEDAMDEFYDLTAESKAEIEEAMKNLSSLTAMVHRSSKEQKKSNEINEFAAEDDDTLSPNNTMPNLTEELFQDTAKTIGNPTVSKNEAILMLFNSGKSKAHIARELNITHNEVDLVLEMNKMSL